MCLGVAGDPGAGAAGTALLTAGARERLAARAAQNGGTARD